MSVKHVHDAARLDRPLGIGAEADQEHKTRERRRKGKGFLVHGWHFSAFLLCFAPIMSHAAITFVDATTAGESGSGDNTVTPAEPTGAAENDLILAFCQIAGVDGAWTDPADFTEIDNIAETNVGPSSHWYVGRKIRAATAGNGYTFSYSGAAAGIACTLIALRGADTTTPLDVTYVRANHYLAGAGPDAHNDAAQPITTNTDGAWVVLLQCMTLDISGEAGPPSGYTEMEDFLTGAPISQGQYAVRKEIATAGTETPGAFTHVDDAAGGDPDEGVFTLAIKPAGAAGLDPGVLRILIEEML